MKFAIVTADPITDQGIRHVQSMGVEILEVKAWRGGTALKVSGELDACLNICFDLVTLNGLQALAMKIDAI